ncbi:MAG: amino acid ABC transporter substrate-binding protein [Acetobacteraceae bacterium]|nr:amino acid ABC transporter substrate-binding protein [Acetobacteraceae bacterium]
MLVLAGNAFAQGASTQGSGSATLDAIRQRGDLRCGVAGTTAGLSLPDSQGVMRGLDADHCRALTAAIFGDASKVKFIPTTAQSRFTALQSGEVDVLFRNTTWTLSREANLGTLFAGVNYYDGTAFLVKKASGVKAAKELGGATVCVAPGTSTEFAVADFFRVNNLKWTPVIIAEITEIRAAFLSGRCDAYSTDFSGLVSFRFSQGDKKDDFVLLPDIISKEPLGPMVRKGDDKFFDLVRWTMFVLLTAEELGVTQANVDSHMESKIPDVRRLLGLEGDLGKALGVDNSFSVAIVKAAGNFGETWDRNITPMGVPRGVNNLWNKGGLHYAPPMR